MRTRVVPPTAAAAAASQAAANTAAAVIAATLPAVFDARNLPADVCVHYDTLHHPTDIVT